MNLADDAIYYATLPLTLVFRAAGWITGASILGFVALVEIREGRKARRKK